MKQMFRGFYRHTDEEYNDLWSKGTFILDASVLCNLYRLPRNASDEMLAVLKNISDRLWVPHHAALEFHRNRLSIISEQKRRFTEVRNVFNATRKEFESGLTKLNLSKRHSVIKPDEFKQKFKDLLDLFEKELAEHESMQSDVSDPDALLTKLDELLDNKIGAPLKGQKEIDDICKEGKIRYTQKIPPGILTPRKQLTKNPASTHMVA